MIDTNDNTVTVCMDYIKGRCSREKCKYFHPPAHLQAKIKAAQYQVNQAAAAQAAATAAAMVSRDLSSVLVNGHKTVNSCIWQQAIHLLTFKNFFFFFLLKICLFRYPRQYIMKWPFREVRVTPQMVQIAPTLGLIFNTLSYSGCRVSEISALYRTPVSFSV